MIVSHQADLGFAAMRRFGAFVLLHHLTSAVDIFTSELVCKGPRPSEHRTCR